MISILDMYTLMGAAYSCTTLHELHLKDFASLQRKFRQIPYSSKCWSTSSSASKSASASSSSAVASWYCWYSDTGSLRLDSASVNSISSMPSPVYQWRKAFLLNMAVNCSAILLKISWMAVELPMKVAAMGRPLGGTSHTATLTLFGIHSTKYDEFLFCTANICSSTSFIDILPRNIAATVRYLPCLGSAAAIMFLASNICWVSTGTVQALYCWVLLATRGANPPC